jgi:hypothetical protein
MNAPLVQDITYYLLSRATREKVSIGTTKLVKLLYLIDHEFYRWERKTLTDAPWLFYHYGPYSEELVSAVATTDGIQPEPIQEFTDGKFYRGYRVTKWRDDVSAAWPPAVRGIVESVYDRWHGVDLPLLLDHVYFETQPMLHATRFQPLDFSVIPDPRIPVETARDFSKFISKGKTVELQQRLLARQGGYRATKPMVVRLDNVSEGAFLAMDDED